MSVCGCSVVGMMTLSVECCLPAGNDARRSPQCKVRSFSTPSFFPPGTLFGGGTMEVSPWSKHRTLPGALKGRSRTTRVSDISQSELPRRVQHQESPATHPCRHGRQTPRLPWRSRERTRLCSSHCRRYGRPAQQSTMAFWFTRS